MLENSFVNVKMDAIYRFLLVTIVAFVVLVFITSLFYNRIIISFILAVILGFVWVKEER